MTMIKLPNASKLHNAFNGKPFLPYLYAAYGMNTARAGMMGRCPMAEPAGKVLLRNHKLVFRGVADVTFALGRQVWLGLWRFTEECESALDRLEGYRKGGGLYDKRYFKIKGAGPLAGQWAMIYVMTSRDYLALPGEGYEGMLRQGYADFGMPASQIDRAIDEANDAAQARIDRVQARAAAMPTRQASVFDDVDTDDADDEDVNAACEREYLMAIRKGKL